MRNLPQLVISVLMLALPAAGAAPAIAANGVKNAASFANPGFPNGSIAQGSIFNVFGSNMGPAALAFASSLPLPTNLSGTSVNVSVGGATAAGFMIYTSAGQLAAILPSSTPIGTGTITVSYNGTPSANAPVKVVQSSFGIFTLNQQGSGQAVIQDGNYQFNSGTFAFQPNETVVLWGTGLGPISGSDANAPPSGNLPGVVVSVSVGGQPATVTYAGRSGYAGDDQVAFTIPGGVTGCNVPVAVTVSPANGSNPVSSNYATISIGTGTACSSASAPGGFQQILNSGGTVRVGSFLLLRSASSSTFSGITTNSLGDGGSGGFSKLSANAYSQGLDLNYGACAINNITPVAAMPTPLDAGPVINVNGPGGAKQVMRLPGTLGSYYTTLGGGAALPGQTPPPLYLDPGTYSVDNGSGGADVGAFKANIVVPPTFSWTNMNQITAVPRSQPLTLTWSGGDPSWDVYIAGSSLLADFSSVSFLCRAKVSAGTLTVPVAILQALPPSATLAGGVASGSLQISTSNGAPQASNPSGLDLFVLGDTQLAVKSGIPYQ